jgi:hypothetical protein
MPNATHTVPFERHNAGGPTIASQRNTRRTMARAALVAIALLLPFGSSASLAAKPKSFDVDFDKCLDPSIQRPGYLFTFAGQAFGDVVGTVEASVVALSLGVEPDQNYIAADYFVVAGTLSFTARVGGRVDDANNQAVLRGYVSEGPTWLIGAGVHDEFENYVRPDGTPCSRGTLEITPRWK